VAQHGYHWGALGVANTNFMPLYPILIRLLQPVVLGSPWIAAWLSANLAFLLALVLIWRWSFLKWGQGTALRVLVVTVAFPFSFFYAAPYAESLFLALAVAAFLFAEEDRWLLAISAAGLSTIARPVGLAVVLGLMALAMARGRPRQAILTTAALAPLLCFVVYLTVTFGHPLAFLTYHSAGWVRPHGGLLTTVTSQFHTHLSPCDRIDAALALLFLVSAALSWRRLGPAYGMYVLVGILLPLVHGLVSVERYVIVLFPAMALWALQRNRVVQVGIFTISALSLVVFTTMYAAGYAVF
jgi:Gpi18-like mannosyltransferase